MLEANNKFDYEYSIYYYFFHKKGVKSFPVWDTFFIQWVSI